MLETLAASVDQDFWVVGAIMFAALFVMMAIATGRQQINVRYWGNREETILRKGVFQVVIVREEGPNADLGLKWQIFRDKNKLASGTAVTPRGAANEAKRWLDQYEGDGGVHNDY